MSVGKGIFIRGFHPVLTQPELKEFFEAFGDIEEIIFNKRQMYAIIEFQERASADFVLSREMFLKGKKLKIVRRKPQFSRHKEMEAATNHPINQETKNSEKEYEIEAFEEAVSFDNFNSQIMKFVKEVEGIDIRRKVEVLCKSLHRSISPSFPGCQIFPFGSSVTGLASKESDVDIYIDIGESKSNEGTHSPSDLVMIAKRILNKNYEFMKCISIPKTRVPILKCIHKITKLNCDINFQNALGIFNSRLIDFYLSLEPHLRLTLMFVKHWAKSNRLCGPGSLTSYAIVMLFLFYIQQMPNSIIPTVEVLQNNCKSRKTVQGWECQFDRDVRNYQKSENRIYLIKILGGFFHFYANFEFEKNVVIMNYGVSVPREHYINAPENSLCQRYKLKLQQRNADPIELDRNMCVLDPFLLNHNITASVGMRVMNKFQIRCFKSAEVCQQIESCKTDLTLQAIVGLQDQKKKTKFPYLEFWKENCVKLILPVKGFNPNNIFETSKCESNFSSGLGLIEVLIFQLKEIFDKILKLSVDEEEINVLPVSSERNQVAKMESMEDVHGHDRRDILHKVTLHLSGYFHVWNGRSAAFKEFSFPHNMKYIEKEMHVTNYIVDTFYQGHAQKLHKVNVKCIFVPIMDFRCLEVEIIPCNQNGIFKQMIAFLLTLLHKWLQE